MAPQVADEMPWRRKYWIRVVMNERDEHAEQQRDQAEVARRHAERETQRTGGGSQ